MSDTPNEYTAKRKQAIRKQKEIQMKNFTTKYKTPITVTVTLLVVVAFAATFYAGTQYQQRQTDVITKAKADAVTTALKPAEK